MKVFKRLLKYHRKGYPAFLRKTEAVMKDESQELLNYPHYAIDSRLVQPNGLFFSLLGERCDGHSFLSDVSKRGGKAAVVSSEYDGDDYGMKLYFMDSPLERLQSLAEIKVKKGRAKVVGITGSVGKTTTKSILASLLKDKMRLMVTPGNQNSQVGLPLAILNEVKGDEHLLILEMAMSEKGNISNLVKIAPPDITLITAIAFAHAKNFSSLEQIALAKGEILAHPSTSLGVLPLDCEEYNLLKTIGSCKKVGYSLSSPLGEKLLSDSRVSFSERHLFHNLLGAVEVALNLGFSYEELAEAFSKITLPLQRLTRIEKNGVIFIDDSYNACTASVKAAIDSLPTPSETSQKVAVLGEMRELGDFSRTCHEEIGNYAINKVDYLFCLGEQMLPAVECWQRAQRPVSYFESKEDLVKNLRVLLQPGDVVLVKGSRALDMGRIIEQV